MRTFHALLIILVVVIVFSCKKDDDPGTEDKSLMSMQVDKDYYTANSEMWFVAWDANGTLLDYKKYDLTLGQTENLTTRLTGLTTETFTAGVFLHTSNGGHLISVYTDLSPGASFVRTAIEYPDFGGTFRVYYPGDIGLGTNVLVSSELFGPLTPSAGSDTEGNKWVDVDIDPTASKYDFVFRSDEVLLHKILSDVNDGDQITLEAGDLVPYEKTATFNLPSTAEMAKLLLIGFESNSDNSIGFFLDEYSNYDLAGQTEITSGYFPSITRFTTQLTVNQNREKSVGFMKSGGLPTTIQWPDVSKYSVISTDPASLSFTATGDLQYIQTSYLTSESKAGHVLYITSPQLAPKIGSVPDEMLQAQPGFNLTTTNFKPFSVAFYVSGAAFGQVSSNYMAGKTGDREQTYVTVKQ